jgi:hypothetical protein
MSKGHRAGGKISGKHTTIIPATEKIIDFLEKQAEVKKISVGFIKQGIKGGKHSLKIIKTTSGLLLKVRGTASIQDIWVYTEDADGVVEMIKDKFT